MKSLRRWLLMLGIFCFAVNILMLTVPLFMLQVYDRVLTTQSQETLLYLVLIAVFALGMLGILDYSRSALLRRIGLWFESEFGEAVIERSVWARLIGGSYETQSQLDLSSVRNTLASPATLALYDLLFSPIFVVCLFLLHPALGVATIVGGIVLLGLALTNARSTQIRDEKAVRDGRDQQRMTQNMLVSARAVDAMGMTSRLARVWGRLHRDGLEYQDNSADRSLRFANYAKSFRLMLQVLILAIGAYYVLAGEMSAGAIIAGSILMGRALQPIDQSIMGWQQVVGGWRAFERLSQFLSTKPLREAQFAPPRPLGDLRVENVSYRYRGASAATIKGVSFALPAGKVMAVAGNSGSGKSTLVDLLSGVLKPLSGRVNLDGSDVFEWPRENFASFFGYVPQRVELVAGTVAENIARFEQASAQDVHAAAQMVNAHELIASFPLGYDTPIGQGGENLSAGQQQRVAMARALFGSPQFVVMDEPDSNLDMEGQRALFQAIGKLKQMGVTVVIVSHRQAVLDLADYLLVMDQGQVKAFGPCKKVIADLSERRGKVAENG